jgi:Tfp pilus assembly protein PilV
VNKKLYKKGFGIVEVLIASVIIIMIVFALVAAGKAALNGLLLSEQRTQAYFLAQEGLEIARQVRDTNWIDSGDAKTNWNSFDYTNLIAPIIRNSRVYHITPYYDSSAPQRYYFPSTGATADSIILNGLSFTRQIQFQSISNILPGTSPDVHKTENSIKITVKVSWKWNTVGSDNKFVYVSDVLTNWRPNY